MIQHLARRWAVVQSCCKFKIRRRDAVTNAELASAHVNKTAPELVFRLIYRSKSKIAAEKQRGDWNAKDAVNHDQADHRTVEL